MSIDSDKNTEKNREQLLGYLSPHRPQHHARSDPLLRT